MIRSFSWKEELESLNLSIKIFLDGHNLKSTTGLMLFGRSQMESHSSAHHKSTKAPQVASARKQMVSVQSQSSKKLNVGNHEPLPRHSPLPPLVAPPLQDDAPPRPPSPDEKDVLPVPPPRPPVPTVAYSPSPDILVPSALPTPIIPSPTPVSSIVYMLPDQPHPRVRGGKDF